MQFVRSADPAPLLTLAGVKDYLRVDQQITDEDALITSLMKAAEIYLDGWSGNLGRCILPQTWTITTADFSDTRLPFPDAGSTIIKYYDASNFEQTLAGSNYRVVNGGLSSSIVYETSVGAIALYERDDAVSIETEFAMVVGVDAVRIAAMMMVAGWYRGREGRDGRSQAVDALLANYRVIPV